MDISTAVRAIFTTGGVHELRIPKAGRFRTISGYFDNPDALATEAAKLDTQGYPAVYITANPCLPALLARSANAVQPYADTTTGDHHIARRRLLPIDLDPDRPTGIPSTDGEHETAGARAVVIRDHLAGLGWPDPVFMDSGNGAYLLYPIDLPNDDASLTLVKDCLEALGRRFDDDAVHVDRTMCNASRIIRVPGTTNRKGSGTPDRPHRRARIISAPDAMTPVSVELLTALADEVRQAPQDAGGGEDRRRTPAPDNFWSSVPSGEFDIQAWLDRYLPAADGPRTQDGKTVWILPICPFNSDHSRGEAYVGQMPSGALYAGCQHDSCTWKWQELREHFEPAATRSAKAATGDQSTQRNTEAPVGRDIDVTNPAEAAAWLRGNIGRGALSGLFDRSGGIAFIAREGEAGYVPPRRKGDDDGPAQVRPVTAAGLAAYVDARYRCFKLVKVDNDYEPKPALFPSESARRVVDLPDPALRPGLRQLAGVTHTPIVRTDGSVMDTPGYDPATRLYYLPEAGVTVPPVPDVPTGEQVKAAVALLDEMTAGFPWKSDYDRANYYGVLLTPLLRALAPPPYKLVVFDAPQQGSGKTLLAQLAQILHGGVLRGGVQHQDDPEMRKVITTILDCTTGAVVIFDNLTGMLDSPVLAGLLTSNEWNDRVLGATREVHAINDRLWTATANNLAVGIDMVRRTLWVGIDPQMPRPQDRTGFTITDLPGWTRAHRGDLLHALLVLVRAWVVAGRPVKPARSSDSFANWVQTVDGILANAGVPGRFDDPGAAKQEAGEQDDEWGDFLAAVYAVFADRAWTTNELLARVSTLGKFDAAAAPMIPLESLPESLAEKAARHVRGPAGIAVSLGRWLMNRDGRFVGEFAVKGAGKDRKDKRLWRVVRLSPESQTGVAGVAGDSSGPHAYARNDSTTDSDETVDSPTPTVSSNTGNTGNPVGWPGWAADGYDRE